MGTNPSAHARCNCAQKALCFLLLFACLVHRAPTQHLAAWGPSPTPMALPPLQKISMLGASAFAVRWGSGRLGRAAGAVATRRGKYLCMCSGHRGDSSNLSNNTRGCTLGMGVCFWKRVGILLEFPHVGSGTRVSSPVVSRCQQAACPHARAAVGVQFGFANSLQGSPAPGDIECQEVRWTETTTVSHWCDRDQTPPCQRERVHAPWLLLSQHLELRQWRVGEKRYSGNSQEPSLTP